MVSILSFIDTRETKALSLSDCAVANATCFLNDFREIPSMDMVNIAVGLVTGSLVTLVIILQIFGLRKAGKMRQDCLATLDAVRALSAGWAESEHRVILEMSAAQMPGGSAAEIKLIVESRLDKNSVSVMREVLGDEYDAWLAKAIGERVSR